MKPASRVQRLDLETSKLLRAAIDAQDIGTLERTSSKIPAWFYRGFLGPDQSLLGYAAHDGSSLTVETLLRLGCDPNEPMFTYGPDKFPYRLYVHAPLARTVGSWDGVYDNIENARVLLAHGALVNGHPSGPCSPLTWAAISGNFAAAKLLVDNGADPYWEGWRYGPALEEAIRAPKLRTETDKVADYLRSLGVKPTYSEWHLWRDLQIEFIERTVGVVNPRPSEKSINETKLSVFAARILAPRQFKHRLLFTRGLAPLLNAELGVFVSNMWPFNKGAFLEERFFWPIELLFRLATGVLAGARLEHGSVVNETDEILKGFTTPVPQWIVAESGALEAARAMGPWDGTVPTLILSPVLTKKRYAPGREAEDQAVKRSAWKWERLHLPLPDLTPRGYEYLKQLDEVDPAASKSRGGAV